MKLPRSYGSQQSNGSNQAFAEQTSRALAAYTITFGDTSNSNTEHSNIDCWKGTGTAPGVANTEFAVPHQLLRVPWGFWIVQKDRAADFYGTPTLGTAWTAATTSTTGNIYIRCSVVSAAFAIIII